jgi:hypothetical protein
MIDAKYPLTARKKREKETTTTSFYFTFGKEVGFFFPKRISSLLLVGSFVKGSSSDLTAGLIHIKAAYVREKNYYYFG